MDDKERLERAQEALGYTFQNPELLSQSLRHPSSTDQRLDSCERMEFLGDAILGMVVVDYLYRAFASMEDGEMTKIKSAVVSRASCAVVAARVGLGELVILGKGMTGRRELPQSVLASVYESVVGALYLDGGLEPAQTFILRDMEDRIRRADRSGHQSNFKSVLQQVAVQRELGVPTYHVLDEKGPDHAKCFEVCVELGGNRFPSCWAASKKQAEQDAALEALHDLGLAYRGERDEVLIRLNPVE